MIKKSSLTKYYGISSRLTVFQKFLTFSFNTFLNDIFMFILKCNLCNCANDNTLYSTGKDLRQIRTNLEMDFMILHHWFHENRIKSQGHYMIISISHQIMLYNNNVTSANEEKLLGIFRDSKLNFGSHIQALFAEKQAKK